MLSLRVAALIAVCLAVVLAVGPRAGELAAILPV
jgi:hypothetical protein